LAYLWASPGSHPHWYSPATSRGQRRATEISPL